MHPTHVLKRPIVTEKSTWESERHNRYAFKVDPVARKPQIKRAVESLYNVRVLHVATQNRKGKNVRTRFGYARTPDWKRAMVRLHEEDRIELF